MNSLKVAFTVAIIVGCTLPAVWAASATINESSIWPNKTVPYFINGNYTPAQLSAIQTAMGKIQNNSCVVFRLRTVLDKDYVNLTKNEDKGCESLVGRQGGMQEVNLKDGCFKKNNTQTHKTDWGTLAHELMHALGFHHEQTRYDRDSYVNVTLSNVVEDGRSNYQVKSANKVTTYGLDYDFESIMHYNNHEFAYNDSLIVMTPLKPLPEGVYMGQRDHFSGGDIAMLKARYCSTPTTTTTTTTKPTTKTTTKPTTTSTTKPTTKTTTKPTTTTTTKPTTKTTTKPTTTTTKPTTKTTTKRTTAAPKTTRR